MKNIPLKLLLLPCVFLLSGARCEKESKDCHHSIIIINNSSQTIMYATKSKYGTKELYCLQGPKLKVGETFDEERNICWEIELNRNRTFEYYIVDTSLFNNQTIFYPIDSIEIKNKVLDHKILSLSDVKNANFKLSYP